VGDLARFRAGRLEAKDKGLSLSSGMRLRLVFSKETPTPASGRERPAEDASLTTVDLWARTKEKPVAE